MLRKHRVALAIKVSFVLIFSGLLIYWSSIAIKKYLDQPTSTYVSYTQGDDNVNVNFPHLTFCDKQNSYKEIKDCSQETETQSRLDFILKIKECLKNDAEFDISGFIAKQRLGKIDEVILAHNLPEATFSKAFYVKFDLDQGPCITFDPTMTNMTTETYSDLQLTLNVSSTTVIMHSNDDYPDACSLHACFEAKQHTEEHLKMKKSFKFRETTRQSPCGDFNQETCAEVKVNEIIAKKYQCKIDLFYTGDHLQKYIEGYANLQSCNKSVILEGINAMNQPHEDCKKLLSCKRTKYDIWKETTSVALSLTYLSFEYPDLEVEHYYTFINYDSQSLIGELGGVLGMFLGLSGLSVGFYCASLLERTDFPKTGRRLKSHGSIMIGITVVGTVIFFCLIIGIIANSGQTTSSTTARPPTTTTSSLDPSTTEKPATACLNGHEYKALDIFAIGGKCYYVEKTELDYQCSMDNCKALFGPDATLVEPENEEENSQIYDQITRFISAEKDFWIGLTDVYNESEWVFSSSRSKAIQFQNWIQNVEVKFSRHEDCAFVQSYGLWDDAACSMQKKSICQFSPQAQTNTKRGYSLGCPYPKWNGDGFCDDVNNIAKCEFDGGDCCLDPIRTDYCDECNCLQYFEGCRQPEWTGIQSPIIPPPSNNETQIWIIGGFPHRTKVTVFNSSCILPDIPQGSTYASAALLNGYPTFCGGMVDSTGGTHGDCYQYKGIQKGWKKMKEGIRPRCHHSTVAIADDLLWITGGLIQSTGYMKDTYFLDAAGRVKPGPDLQEGVGMHRSTITEDGQIFITGGFAGWAGGGAKSSVWVYQSLQDDVVFSHAGPDLPKGWQSHGCAIVTSLAHDGRQVLLIAGGGQQTATSAAVWDFTVTGSSWTSLPDLPYELDEGPGVYQIHGDGNKILMFDDWNFLEMTISNEGYEYRQVLWGHWLNDYPRNAFAIVLVPPSSKLTCEENEPMLIGAGRK